MLTILAGLGAAAGTFVVAAIAFAVLDLYLSGHGRPSPMQHPSLRTASCS